MSAAEPTLAVTVLAYGGREMPDLALAPLAIQGLTLVEHGFTRKAR